MDRSLAAMVAFAAQRDAISEVQAGRVAGADVAVMKIDIRTRGHLDHRPERRGIERQGERCPIGDAHEARRREGIALHDAGELPVVRVVEASRLDGQR